MRAKEFEGYITMPLKGHPYHTKSEAELNYIIKDAGQAARNMKGMDSNAEAKYLDQMNDASTVLGYRRAGGQPVKVVPGYWDKLKDPKGFSEGIKPGDKVTITGGEHKGKEGRVGEIRRGYQKGKEPEYTIDHDFGDDGHHRSSRIPKKHFKKA